MIILFMHYVANNVSHKNHLLYNLSNFTEKNSNQ